MVDEWVNERTSAHMKLIIDLLFLDSADLVKKKFSLVRLSNNSRSDTYEIMLNAKLAQHNEVSILTE